MSKPTILSYLAGRLVTIENTAGPLLLSADETAANARTNAYAGQVGMLQPSNTSNGSSQVQLSADSGATARADGLTLRFHHNSTTSEDYWAVYESNGTTHLFDIYGQESYTLIWRNTDNDWLIVSGITR